MEHVRSHFRPEFVNRVDEFITFDPLVREQIKQIVRLRSQRLVDRLAEKRIGLQLSEGAVEYLADKGCAPPSPSPTRLRTRLIYACDPNQHSKGSTVRAACVGCYQSVTQSVRQALPLHLKGSCTPPECSHLVQLPDLPRIFVQLQRKFLQLQRARDVRAESIAAAAWLPSVGARCLARKIFAVPGPELLLSLPSVHTA